AGALARRGGARQGAGQKQQTPVHQGPPSLSQPSPARSRRREPAPSSCPDEPRAAGVSPPKTRRVEAAGKRTQKWPDCMQSGHAVAAHPFRARRSNSSSNSNSVVLAREHPEFEFEFEFEFDVGNA